MPAQPFPRLFLNGVDFIVGSIGIVVIQDEVLHLGGRGEGACLAGEAVAPAVLERHVAFLVLGIVDEDIRIPAEPDESVELRGFRVRRVELVVGEIDRGAALALDSVAESPAGVIGGDFAGVDPMAAEKLQVVAGDAVRLRRQALGAYRKMGAVHLIEQGADGVVFGPVGEQADVPRLLVNGMEKREAVDVIPVRVGENDINFRGVAGKKFSQIADARPGIENQCLVPWEMNAGAGRIAPVTNRRRTRAGN